MNSSPLLIIITSHGARALLWAELKFIFNFKKVEYVNIVEVFF
jgi:hypothetical protein